MGALVSHFRTVASGTSKCRVSSPTVPSKSISTGKHPQMSINPYDGTSALRPTLAQAAEFDTLDRALAADVKAALHKALQQYVAFSDGDTPLAIFRHAVATARKASDRRLVRPILRGTLLGLEIGTSQATLPVVAGCFRRTPHIVLSGAFLALHASVCNRWPRRWVPGGRRDWRPGRTCRIRFFAVFGGTGGIASRTAPRPPRGHPQAIWWPTGRPPEATLRLP